MLVRRRRKSAPAHIVESPRKLLLRVTIARIEIDPTCRAHLDPDFTGPVACLGKTFSVSKR